MILLVLRTHGAAQLSMPVKYTAAGGRGTPDILLFHAGSSLSSEVLIDGKTVVHESVIGRKIGIQKFVFLRVRWDVYDRCALPLRQSIDVAPLILFVSLFCLFYWTFPTLYAS